MKRYTIRSTILCNVTWTYSIEAETTDAALEKYWSGDHSDPVNMEIGDSIGDSSEQVSETITD